MGISLDTAQPQFLFSDMLKEGSYTCELLGTRTMRSKDGTKDLLFLHIKLFDPDKGGLVEYYLSKWRAKSLRDGFNLETGVKYQIRKEGINFVFS